jgi:4-hydroxyphenylpyruvate dioxygenase
MTTPGANGSKEPSHIGILGYDSFHFVVENLKRSSEFYTRRFGFKEVARSSPALSERSGQESVVFGAGDVRVCVSTPLSQRSKASRYLRRHPDGVMSLGFRVENLDRTMAFLESRGGTILADPIDEARPDGGRYRSFEIATPLGDVAFRFVERTDYPEFAPGFVDSGVGNAGRPANEFGIAAIDHVTSNGLTMQPIVGWYRDVLGFEPFWEISFHTKDVAAKAARESGSGLRSVVMWDPESGVKFATNEPLRPFFRDSQISKFVDDNWGNGIQHIAFAVPDILRTVEEMQHRDVEFMQTHPAYYRDLPARLQAIKVTNVKEDLKELERLQVLVDGADDKYMLQIFLREAAALYDESRAGPFFYEIIQRAGDPGFGYGNFRALFESIERAQQAAQAGVAAARVPARD